MKKYKKNLKFGTFCVSRCSTYLQSLAGRLNDFRDEKVAHADGFHYLRRLEEEDGNDDVFLSFWLGCSG